MGVHDYHKITDECNSIFFSLRNESNFNSRGFQTYDSYQHLNDQMSKQALVESEERRKVVVICLRLYQQMVAQHYNSSIRPWSFQVGKLVLRKVFKNTKEKINSKKLEPNWEGPYLVTAIPHPGVYKL